MSDLELLANDLTALQYVALDLNQEEIEWIRSRIRKYLPHNYGYPAEGGTVLSLFSRYLPEIGGEWPPEAQAILKEREKITPFPGIERRASNT